MHIRNEDTSTDAADSRHFEKKWPPSKFCYWPYS